MFVDVFRLFIYSLTPVGFISTDEILIYVYIHGLNYIKSFDY